MCNLIAIIPTTASRLYNTFGLDFAVPAQYDPETPSGRGFPLAQQSSSPGETRRKEAIMAPIDYSIVIEVAHHVEWYGHQSRASIVRKFGAGADAAIDAAVELGLLQVTPRLGGFTATRKVKSELFGDRYAAAWA